MKIRRILVGVMAAVLLAACGSPATAIPVTGPTSTAVRATPTRPSIPTETPIPTVSAETVQPGQYAYSYMTSSGTQVRYLLYVPQGFNAGKKWPLVVFLHSSLEVGTDLDMLKTDYLPKLLDEKKDLPFLVVSPLLPDQRWDMFIDAVDELVTHLEQSLPIDAHRLYLTGASLGAFGTWAYALKYPDRFAAIAPMSGGYIRGVKKAPPDICKLKPVAAWIFHGAQDDTTPVWQSQIMVDALKACGGDVKFTLYPDASHVNTWIRAYQDPALWDWLLAHSR